MLPPHAVELLLDIEPLAQRIVEPCCGQGHISRVLEAHGHTVISRDLYDYGYGEPDHDFLMAGPDDVPDDCDIVTNPPYKYAREFAEQSLRLLAPGRKCVMFLKLTFLEGKGRKPLFDTGQLRTVYVSRSRLNCGMNGEFSGTSAVAYAWFVWEKGWRGEPVIRWFN